MKFFKVLLSLIFLTALLLGGAALYIYSQRIPLVEKAANQAAHELFEGSLRLKSVDLTGDGHISMTGVTGNMKTDTGSQPVELGKIETKTPLWEMIRTRRSELAFENFRPIPAKGNSISGTLHVRFGHYSSVKIIAPLDHIFVSDYAWLDPASFEGLSGTVSGQIQARIDSRENATFNLDLRADEKGGEVPAKFLNFALPYLPAASQNSKQLKKLIANSKSVHFTTGIVQAGITEPGKMQAQIKMMFPEQNLNLNLNLTILVDEKHAFFRAFKLLGLFKIRNSGAQ